MNQPLGVRGLGLFVLVGLTSFSWACGHGRPTAPQSPQPPSARSPQSPEALIAAGDANLEAGLQLLREGHLTRAREAFDRAVEVYLTAPGGAYADPRTADAYRRTLDVVHLRELEALAAGDGFTEVPSEPASIDEVGEIPVAEQPVTEETRRMAREAARVEHNDLPIELNDAVLSCVALYQGRLRDWFMACLLYTSPSPRD